MAWETRLNWYRYYVVSVRRGARVLHFTFKGQAAEIAAYQAESRREARQKAVATRREYRELRAQARASLDELDRFTKVLQEVILLVAGFHQHARGVWRRRIRAVRHDGGVSRLCRGASRETGRSQNDVATASYH